MSSGLHAKAAYIHLHIIYISYINTYAYNHTYLCSYTCNVCMCMYVFFMRNA